ncbi:MAG TPA: biotin/lipoyl-containing protein, partial [Candidatus Obscuribacterales bacterium]
TAMMAGIVVEVLVKPGDAVADSQDVVILESMKMQLPVQSNLTGTVSEVKVSAGDFVNEGDPLVVLS